MGWDGIDINHSITTYTSLTPLPYLAVKSAIHKVDVDHSKDLYGNIVLVGGCSSITGLRDRLEMAVTERAPISTHQGTMRVRVVMPTAGPEVRGGGGGWG